MINDIEDDINETARELDMDATATKESYGQAVTTDVSEENVVEDIILLRTNRLNNY